MSMRMHSGVMEEGNRRRLQNVKMTEVGSCSGIALMFNLV